MLPASAAVPAVWQVPSCRVIPGTPAVTFTHDVGQTLTPLSRSLPAVSYTTELVGLDVPNRPLAIKDTELLNSNDAGCRFTPLARRNREVEQPGILSKSVADRAYAWAGGGPELLRIDGTQLVPLRSLVAAVYGLAADAADRARVRLGDQSGQLWESLEANALCFIFGTSSDNYGTDIYRVDGLTGIVSRTHNAYHRMIGIAFNPADPSLIYFGLGVENVGGI